MFYAFCVFSVIVYGFSTAEKLSLPPITICKRDSVNYSNCLTAAIQEAWPQFVKGLPEFDFPSLDPLIYESGKVVLNRSMIYGIANVSNFILTGFSKTRFLAARSHFADKIFRLEIDIQIPKIAGSGECDAVGTLGGFRMGGKGHLDLTVEDLQTTWIIKGHVANDTWTINDFNAAPSIKKLKVHFEDLFGSKELNNFAVNFVNEYWPSLYHVILPIMEKVWNPWLCSLVNRFFSKISFTEMFP